MIATLAAVTRTAWFQNAVLVAILLAGAIAGLETVPSWVDRYGAALAFANGLVQVVFVAELAIKIGAEGRRPWRFFRDGWNVFDFVIVVTSLLPLHAEYLTVLRLARVLRFLRLVRSLPRLQIIVGALLKSIPSMGYVGLLLAILFYMYGILGVTLFAANDPFHFGTLGRAALTLFGCATGEGWVDVMYTQMYGCSVFPVGEVACDSSQPQPVLGAVFFVSFMMMGAMVMLNLLVGVILNGMEETAKENADLDAEQRGGAFLLAAELEAVERDLAALQGRLETARRRANAPG